MHVPQIGHMDRILRAGGNAKEECGGRHAECHKKSQNRGGHEQQQDTREAASYKLDRPIFVETTYSVLRRNQAHSVEVLA